MATMDDDAYRQSVECEVQPLDNGSYGRVYAARWSGHDKPVAVKICNADEYDGCVSVCAYRECVAYTRLAHVQETHVPRLHAVAVLDDSRVALVLQRCALSLSKWLRIEPAPLPLSTVQRWFRRLTEAIATAHSIGLAHRDIKPANVLLVCGGDAARDTDVLLADWGSSRCDLDCGSPEQAPSLGVRRWSMPVMTPGFEAPEHLLRVAASDPLAFDVWGLGVTLCSVLLGKDALLVNVTTSVAALDSTLAVFGVPTEEQWPQFSTHVHAYCEAKPQCERGAPQCPRCKPRGPDAALFRAIRKRYAHDDQRLVQHAIECFVACCTMNPAKRPTAQDALRHLAFVQAKTTAEPISVSLRIERIRPALCPVMAANALSRCAEFIVVAAHKAKNDPETAEMAVRLWYGNLSRNYQLFAHDAEACVLSLWQAQRMREVYSEEQVQYVQRSKALWKEQWPGDDDAMLSFGVARLQELERRAFPVDRPVRASAWHLLRQHDQIRTVIVSHYVALCMPMFHSLDVATFASVVAAAIDVASDGAKGTPLSALRGSIRRMRRGREFKLLRQSLGN